MTNIVFTDYPGHMVTLLLGGALLALLLWSFRSSTLRSVPILRWVLGALNLGVILVLIALTWNPSRVRLIEQQEQNTLLLCFDTSESMSVLDSTQSRLDQALTVFDRHFAQRQTDKPRCRWFGFDSECRTISRMDMGQQWGSQSKLEAALARLGATVAAKRGRNEQDRSTLSGVVVFTDGQVDNKQVQSYAKLQHKNSPVLIVACGDDRPRRDVKVRAVKAPVSVRADQRYDVVAQITGQHLKDQPVEVELWINDVLTERTSTAISEDNEVQDVRFSAYALAPGIDEVRVVVDTVDGEVNLHNNACTRLVEIRANAPMRVLFYSQVASFDIGRIRQCLARDLRIQLDFVYNAITDPKLAQEHADERDHFPESPAELNLYDLIVLGPCDFNQFASDRIADLYDFVTKRGGSVIFLPGRESFGLAGCTIPEIRTLIPVAFDNSADIAFTQGLSLTEDGRDQHYSEAVCFEDRADDINVAYSRLSKKPAASTVLRCGQQPLVCTQRLGRGRTVLVNSSNLYQLYRADEDKGPLFRLLSDVITQVAEQPNQQSHIEVFVRRTHDTANLVFEALVSDQAYDAAQQATVLLEFNGRIISMEETWPGTYMSTIPDFQDSSVFARVRVEHRDVYLGEKALAVELDKVRREMDETGCDKAFLRALCEHIGAAYVDANQVGPETFDRFQPYHVAQQDAQLQSIWPRWPVFLCLCSLMMLQWFLRRAKGLV